MHRIYKRAGIYWIQFRGRRRSLRTRDRKAAELAARLIERRAADPTYRPEDQTTLGRALKDFVARQTERGRAPETLGMYDTHIAHLARVLDEHTPIALIDAPEVDRYISTRHKEGASRSTQWKELCTLRGTLKLARRQKKYPHALDEVMPQDFEIGYVPLDRSHTREQFEKLLAALTPKRAAVCAFIVATAADLRSVELAQPRDVDLKTWRALVHGTKNKHRLRTVPIVLPFFRSLLRLAKPFMPFDPWSNVRRDLAVACKNAKVPKVTPRDLRRTHGKLLRAMGVEPHLIAKDMGHADSRMVERVYGQLPVDDHEALLAERLKKRIGTKPVQKRRTKARKRKEKAA